MSEFNAKRINVNNINSGQKYQNGDVLQASALNEIVDGILHNSQETENINIKSGKGKDSVVQVYTGKVDDTHYESTSTGENAAIFGEANKNTANRALMAGKLNENNGANSIVGGIWNSNNAFGTHSFVIGNHNQNEADSVIIGGAYNKANYKSGQSVVVGSYNETGASGSVTAGAYNKNLGSVNIVSGVRNEVKLGKESTIVCGRDNVIDVNNGSAFGYGLKVEGLDGKTVVGRYNDPKDDTIFEVGNGTSDKRSNAFEVYKDGSWWSASGIYHLSTTLNSNEYVQLDETDTLAFASIMQDQMKLLNFKNVAVVIQGEEGTGHQLFINLSISRKDVYEIKFSYEGLFCNLEIIANLRSGIITAKIL